jgi:protoheme ferro-lyase
MKDGTRLKSRLEYVHQKSIEEMEKSGIKIFSQKPLTHSLTSFCPQCNNHGIPKIEKKNRKDYRFRSGRYSKKVLPNTFGQKIKVQPKRKNPKFYLSYTHGKGKKCWIKPYKDLPVPRLTESKHISKKIVCTNPYLYQNILETLQKKFAQVI